jgi:hypothetical protein
MSTISILSKPYFKKIPGAYPGSVIKASRDPKYPATVPLRETTVCELLNLQ